MFLFCLVKWKHTYHHHHFLLDCPEHVECTVWNGTGRNTATKWCKLTVNSLSLFQVLNTGMRSERRRMRFCSPHSFPNFHTFQFLRGFHDPVGQDQKSLLISSWTWRNRERRDEHERDLSSPASPPKNQNTKFGYLPMQVQIFYGCSMQNGISEQPVTFDLYYTLHTKHALQLADCPIRHITVSFPLVVH